MAQVEDLSELIAEIYDAALDPSRWRNALRLSGDFVGGVQGSIFWHDSAVSEIAVMHLFNENPDYTRSYFEKYVRMNPLFPASTFLEPGKVYAATDVVPVEEFIQTRFYQEWVRPQGLMDAVAANLERSTTGSAMLAFRWPAERGVVDEDGKARMALVVPHVRRALAIGHLLEDHVAKSAALAETLDKVAAGVFLVDGNNRIVYDNAAAREMSERQRLVRAPRGLLGAADHAADRLLKDALTRAAKSDAALGVRGVEIRLPSSDGHRWLAHVLPLTGGARKLGGREHDATAAVFVRRTSIDTPSALAAVASLYRLTASEVRTLVGVLEVGGVSAIARDAGVSPATVKSHLQKLFAKTGTRRQADLVKLVASYGGNAFNASDTAAVEPA